jgi:hypothetical protein
MPLPPVNRSIGVLTRCAAEVVISGRTLGRQRRTDRGDRSARTVDRHGNAAALEVRYAPAADTALYTEAISTRRAETAGVASRFDGCAAGAAGSRAAA